MNKLPDFKIWNQLLSGLSLIGAVICTLSV